MTEIIKHVCVPFAVTTIMKLKEVCGTDENKEAITDAVEFRIRAGKIKKEV